MILRTLIAPDSWGQSLRSELRSRLIMQLTSELTPALSILAPLIQFPVFLPSCFNRTVEREIDSFIRSLATERGLSDNYQLSTRRSLTEFAAWCSAARQITTPADVTQQVISDYLSSRKKGGLSASSIK